MNSPAHDIALFLAEQGEGYWGGNREWCISVNGEPASPDDAITIYDTPGGEPDTDELDIFRPSLQVRVRSHSWQKAYNKQIAIRDLLIFDPVDAASSYFELIVMSSDVMSLGKDDSNRHLLTANYRARRTEKE